MSMYAVGKVLCRDEEWTNGYVGERRNRKGGEEEKV